MNARRLGALAVRSRVRRGVLRPWCQRVRWDGHRRRPVDRSEPGRVDCSRRADRLRRGLAQGRPRSRQGGVQTAAPGVSLTIATDASSTLRTQIEQGAPADVFLSADQTNPKTLVEGGLADGSAVDFAGNTLTVIVPAANPAGITTPADLARSGVKVIAAGADVPIAKYTTQVVANLAGTGGLPGGVRGGLRRERGLEGGQRQGGRRQDRTR